MRFLKRLTRSGDTDRTGEYTFGEVRIRPAGDLESDPDLRMEEYWIEAVETDPGGYWVLVGRRYGFFQLYDWSGKLYRLPSRPPSRTVTDIVFRKGILSITAPPYVVVYSVKSVQNPDSWKAFRISEEGLRPSGGLDVDSGRVIFSAAGGRICTVDIRDLESGKAELRSFSLSSAEIGDVIALRAVSGRRLFIAGTEGSVLCTEEGRILKRFGWRPVRSLILNGDLLIVGDTESRRILLRSCGDCEEIAELTFEHNVSAMDLSPDGRFLFTADAEENILGVYDLRERRFLGHLEGYGYSVVKISPDSCVYTARREDTAEGSLYHLEKLVTNLTDFTYPPERQRKIVRHAGKLYSALLKRIRSARREEELDELEELRELESIEIPLRSVRELIREIKQKREERRREIFVAFMENRLRSGCLNRDDWRRLEEGIESAEGDYRERLEELKARVEDHLRREAERHTAQVERAVDRLTTLSRQELESLPEVVSARGFAEELPADLRRDLLSDIETILLRRIVESRMEILSLSESGGEIRIGRERFPRYDPQPVRYRWRMKVEDKLPASGAVFGRILFEREDGLVIEPRRYPNVLPLSRITDAPAWTGRYLRHLNALLSAEPLRVPEAVSYEAVPWFVENLEKLVSLVKEQLEYGEGVLVLEGDAGVGKNFLVEVFAALTRRPLFTVSCSSKMEREDVTFVYEFDPRRGTRRVYSDLVRALETPGAVIYFDEINTLPPSLVKLFNPLFDYRRHLPLSYGKTVKAHPEVILIGGMNPQNYLGVAELPQDVKSRADVLYIDYPPFEEKGGLYYPDEALILRKYTDHLAELSMEDFTHLWYFSVNRLVTGRSKALATPEREEEITMLFELLKIANRIRNAYRLYQTQRSEEPVEFVFSIRDTVRCARRLRRYRSAKRAVLETVIPKISSPLEREIVTGIVEETQ